jgi:hypothetical protein
VEPTTLLSCALGVIAFMKAALGVRLAAFLAGAFLAAFAAFFAGAFFAALFFAGAFLAAPFLAALFFAVFFAAMLVSWNGEQVLALRETLYDGAQDTKSQGVRNRECNVFPYENDIFLLCNAVCTRFTAVFS